MALTFVGGKTAAFAGTTSPQAVALSGLAGGVASAPAAGDIVIVAYATGSDMERAVGVQSAGYTEEQSLHANSPGDDTNLSVSWKIMGASPDSHVVVSQTGSTSDAGAVAIHVWRGMDQATPFDVPETTDSGSGTPQADPPPITPVTEGSHVITIGAGAALSLSDFSSPDLANFVTVSSADENDAAIGMGSIAWNGSGPVDPAQFGGGNGGHSNRSWAAVTLALRPLTATAYLLDGESGNHGLGGAAAALRKTMGMAAAGGVLSIGGIGAVLRHGHVMPAAPGAHAMAATGADFIKVLRLIPAIGGMAVAGAAANFRRGYILPAGDGQHILAGDAAELVADLRAFTTGDPDPERILALKGMDRIARVRGRELRSAASVAQTRSLVLRSVGRGHPA